MLVDGLPTGFSLLESYLFDFVEMRNALAAKIANRVTQLFGRTNRGRNDYSVIFVSDRRFITWLSSARNQVLLPELLQKQILLGKSVVDQFQIDDVNKFPQLAKQVLGRDAAWLNFYGESIAGMAVGSEEKLQGKEVDQILTDAAVAEAEFAMHLWDGRFGEARDVLGTTLERVVVADRKLAAWYNILIGSTFELQGDAESAAKQYNQARLRANIQFPLPVPTTSESIALREEAKNRLQKRLLEIFANDIRITNDNIARHKREIAPLFARETTFSRQEESLRVFGELLGFIATRPEQEDDNDSTLDVLWRSEETNEAILFSVKTNKHSDSVLNIDEIGQGHNHLQWTRKHEPQLKVLGLIFVCETTLHSQEASPSQEMCCVTIASLKSLYDHFEQTLWALQKLPPLDRYAQINDLVRQPEWQASGIFKRLSCSSLRRAP